MKNKLPGFETDRGIFNHYPEGKTVDLGVVSLRVYFVREPRAGDGWNEVWRWRCGKLESSGSFLTRDEAMWDSVPVVREALKKAVNIAEKWGAAKSVASNGEKNKEVKNGR